MLGFFRFLAIALIVLALVLLGGDVVTSLEKGDIVMRSMTETLALLGADPTHWVETTLPAPVSDVAETILSWPGWAILGVLGLVIGALSLGPREYDDDRD